MTNNLIHLRRRNGEEIAHSNIAAKEPERQQIAEHTRAYLARGGTIQIVDHTANRKKPTKGFNNSLRPDANGFLFGGNHA